MQVTTVRYERLVNLGNYENEKVGIEVMLEPGESPHEALQRAQAFVEKSLVAKVEPYRIEQAERILAHRDAYPPTKVQEAEALLRQVGPTDIPF